MSTDRYRGCLVGLALGDALGAPYEFQSAPEPDGRFHRGVFGTEPGHPTDDTMLAMALAESLLECRGWRADDFGRRLAAWVDTDPPDVGRQCRLAAESWRRGGPPPVDPAAQGNGSLMAVAPMGLASTGPGARQAGRRFSSAMHPSEVSGDICGAFTERIERAVSGTPDHLEPIPLPEDPAGPKMGWVRLSYAVAVGAFLRTTSTPAVEPVEVLLGVIRLGGDTDTNAAIAGALIGAHHGMDAWPSHLVGELAMAARMVELADGLHALAHPSPTAA